MIAPESIAEILGLGATVHTVGELESAVSAGLPKHSLERLSARLYADRKIASANKFSTNSSTACLSNRARIPHRRCPSPHLRFHGGDAPWRALELHRPAGHLCSRNLRRRDARSPRPCQPLRSAEEPSCRTYLDPGASKDRNGAALCSFGMGCRGPHGHSSFWGQMAGRDANGCSARSKRDYRRAGEQYPHQSDAPAVLAHSGIRAGKHPMGHQAFWSTLEELARAAYSGRHCQCSSISMRFTQATLP